MKGVIILKLSDREEKILSAIIEHFISTGDPVGSKFLSESLPMTVSPATIRNEMAFLSENGYLSQPHTSAGRIPADKGYRYYIEKLLLNYAPSDSDMFRISSGIDADEGDPGRILSEACEVLSDITGCTVIATTPDCSGSTVVGTRIVPVGRNAVMTVVSTSSGSLKSRIARTDSEPGYEVLQLFYNTVSAHFSDVAIGEISLASLQSACAGLSNRALELIPLMVSFYDCVSDALKGDVVVRGIQNVLNSPELRGGAVGITQLLNSEEELIRIFSLPGDEEFGIKIGEENEFQCLKNAAVIKAAYKTGENSKGSIGVIAPTKIDYSGILPLIKYTAEVVGEAMTTAAGTL